MVVGGSEQHAGVAVVGAARAWIGGSSTEPYLARVPEPPVVEAAAQHSATCQSSKALLEAMKLTAFVPV